MNSVKVEQFLIFGGAECLQSTKSQRGWKTYSSPEDWVHNQPHALESGVQVQSQQFLLLGFSQKIWALEIWYWSLETESATVDRPCLCSSQSAVLQFWIFPPSM